ncbi:methyltransferase family protein [Labrys monachus]|uniref:Protein-S-isoprenylcysteine O-methyltransferase Ste14 n=1 Tax=Labrys monachus TaxID=217067 RepID=A0ABU0FHY3_9HYPH|nr:isoprenylcysteine carboxylmethyltransferase family protein [Labrys monachus]MDQ0394219.1 protein-S-isoprenylcysteine O-methyltransferase Ste14 [Labrys monachus]
MQVVDVVPLLAFAGLVAMIAVRTAMFRRRGIRSVADMHEAPRREIALKQASMAVFWLFGLFALLYAWGTPITDWVPGLLAYQIQDSSILRVIGAVLCLAGVAMYPFAQFNMGDFWRVGIDREVGRADAAGEQKGLVMNGLFAVSRNPIYIMLDAIFVGAFLVHGRLIFLVIALAYIAITHCEILNEERFLNERFGDEYVAYKNRVSRYLFGF